MFSFFGGVLLVPFPLIQSIYSDHVHCVHGRSESKHDKERYTQKCSNFFILQHVSSNFEILCVCDVLFVVFSKLIYQSKANPFPRCVYLYRSKTAFNSQSSILCTYVKRRRWKKEPVRNQSSVHIWTVWKRKSKLNTENKRIFFLIELPWLRERENEVYWLPQIFFMTFYLLFLYWLKCFLFLGT